MLERFVSHLIVGVSSDGVSIARAGLWPRARARLLAERRIAPAGDACDIGRALGEVLAAVQPRGAAITIVLADELARMWQVEPPRESTRMSDLHAAAALRFGALFGASPAGWRIAARWDAASPFLAFGAPQALLSALEEAVRAHQCHLVEVVPQFVAALHRWRRTASAKVWFGTVHAQVLTLALFDDAGLAAVRSAAVPADASRAWLDAQLMREALRVGVARPGRLLLCGPAPARWASEPGQASFACTLLGPGRDEALSDPARLACTANVTRSAWMNLAPPGMRRAMHCTPLHARALAVAALALVPALAASAGAYTDALRRYDSQLAANRALRQRPAVQKAGPPERHPAPEQARAVNAAIMQLNLPWRSLHDAVQAATPPNVALLSLEPDAGKRVLRITAEAKTSEDMIGYVERMKEQDWFSGVAIIRHEINEQDANHPMRFQLDAQWRQQ